MLKSYLTIAIRMMLKNKVFTLINIAGLALGISASLVIYLLVSHDLSFDTFHKDRDRIYRVVSTFNFSGESFYNAGVAMPLGRVIKSEIPGIEQAASLYTAPTETVLTTVINGKHTRHRNQSNITYAMPEYFAIFSYKWLTGSAAASLSQPYQTILTKQKAALLFPGISPVDVIGQQLVVDDSITTRVTGIVDELQGNTDLTFSVFISFATMQSEQLHTDIYNDWDGASSQSQLFVKLPPGQTPAQTARSLEKVFLKYGPKPVDGNASVSPFLLQPLGELHFDGRYGNYFDNRMGDRRALYGLLLVAGFILLLACINFINLSTAQSSQRAKEIGIRKTIGSSKKQITFQFLVEVFVTTILSSALSVISLPYFLRLLRDFVPRQLVEQPFPGLHHWYFLAILIICVTLLAGFYPAWILSRLTPLKAIRNANVVTASGGAWIRKVLTCAQFVIAQVFIIGVLAVSSQLRYALEKEPGFRTDAIIYFQAPGEPAAGKLAALAEKIKAVPGVELLSLSNNPVAATGTWSTTLTYKARTETATNVQLKMADTNFLQLYRLNLLAGRNIRPTDSINEFVINNTYAKTLGFVHPDEALGKTVEYEGRHVPVVGVVADFHQQSLHVPIKPLAIASWPVHHQTFNIALPVNASSQWSRTISKIDLAYHEIYPNIDFEYNFQDETIGQYYESDRRTSFLLKASAAITVLLSCLGLLGLTMYSAARRKKEIGIRKVLGSTVRQILALLSRDLVAVTAIASLIALPVSWWLLSEWLQNFAYSTPLGWWMFATGALAPLLIGIITVGAISWKTANASPVKSLQTD